MWVEESQENQSHACMITFYPDFELSTNKEAEIILILDASCSMQGSSIVDLKKSNFFFFLSFFLFFFWNY